jgi:hypothetical protein
MFGVLKAKLSGGDATMPRQPTEAETSEILREVQAYLNLPVEELNKSLDDSIDEADSLGLPHRGISDKQFWQQYVTRLKQELLQQRVAASATAGLAVSKAIAMAHEVGIDLNDYRIPIAIAVALAVKSFWDQMSAGGDDQGEDGEVDGDTRGR